MEEKYFHKTLKEQKLISYQTSSDLCHRKTKEDGY